MVCLPPLACFLTSSSRRSFAVPILPEVRLLCPLWPLKYSLSYSSWPVPPSPQVFLENSLSRLECSRSTLCHSSIQNQARFEQPPSATGHAPPAPLTHPEAPALSSPKLIKQVPTLTHLTRNNLSSRPAPYTVLSSITATRSTVPHIFLRAEAPCFSIALQSVRLRNRPLGLASDFLRWSVAPMASLAPPQLPPGLLPMLS